MFSFSLLSKDEKEDEDDNEDDSKKLGSPTVVGEIIPADGAAFLFSIHVHTAGRTFTKRHWEGPS